MATKSDLPTVFDRLKAIFAPYEKRMEVACDTNNNFMLNTRYIMRNKQPLCFGGVRLGKNYVSFYLMSVYTCPDELETISPDLKKRMQDKSCFNFKEVDGKLFRELANLTKAGAQRFSDEKFIESLRKAQAAAKR